MSLAVTPTWYRYYVARRRFIFLDLDGVLRPFHSEEMLVPECVERLNRLVEVTGAEVIITSSWRAQLTLEKILAEMRAVGFRHELGGETPILLGQPRGVEIRAFLEQAGVVPFVILDDEIDMDAELRKQLVLVDDAVGLQEADVDEALTVLDGGLLTIT
jgi:hypothetical protein